jgi:hypothetical protein
MGWLIFIGGIIVGGALGFVGVCMFVINSPNVADRQSKKR